MGISKKIWIPLLILTTLIVLRESGCVVLHLANCRFDNHAVINLHSTYYVDTDEKRLPYSEDKKITEQYPKITVLFWNTSISLPPESTLLTGLEERVEKASEAADASNIKIQNIELTGLYWLPLYKSGACRYTFKIEAVKAGSKEYNGDGSGEIKFSTFGTISVNEIKDKISEQLAADLSSTLKREVK